MEPLRCPTFSLLLNSYQPVKSNLLSFIKETFNKEKKQKDVTILPVVPKKPLRTIL